MKRTTLALAILCAFQSALIAYLCSRNRLSAGPGCYSTLETKHGDAILLQGSSPKLELSYLDGGDGSSFDATFKTGEGDIVVTGYFVEERPALAYFIRRNGEAIRLGKIDADGIPAQKSVTSAGQTTFYDRKDIEWIPRTK
jgi:hypothetical protein